MPDTDGGAARDAGIDAAVLNRLLSSMNPEDRGTIRELCARDLEMTREGARSALKHGDAETLARHLHVLSSLALTVGAEALAREAAGMQAQLRSGTTPVCDAGARRMDDLARRAARFLAECAG